MVEDYRTHELKSFDSLNSAYSAATPYHHSQKDKIKKANFLGLATCWGKMNSFQLTGINEQAVYHHILPLFMFATLVFGKLCGTH